jgi:hypothetical protein
MSKIKALGSNIYSRVLDRAWVGHTGFFRNVNNDGMLAFVCPSWQFWLLNRIKKCIPRVVRVEVLG